MHMHVISEICTYACLQITLLPVLECWILSVSSRGFPIERSLDAGMSSLRAWQLLAALTYAHK